VTGENENGSGSDAGDQRLSAAQRRRRQQRAAADKADAEAAASVRVVEVAPAARPAGMRLRHWLVILAFLLAVVLPTGVAGWYLYTLAADQYASRVGFTVRKEETGSAFEILGGITELSGSSSSDTDILYEFIQSQEMVREVNARLDLGTMYRRPENDPVFALKDDATIEDLMDYWGRMVRIQYDPGTGLIEVEARAFTAEDSREISRAIFALSSDMINTLSAVAREDTTRYAKEELDQAVERLKEARLALTRFRNETQIVDPTADIQGQMGLLNNLQAQLASTLIELDLLSNSTRESDPRIEQAKRKIEVIQARIQDERRKLGTSGGTGGDEGYAEVIGQFESLQVDREFSEKAYVSALSAYDTAVAEARRQSRYLAAYVKPTLPESAEYPQRELILAVVFLVMFGIWCLLVLIGYSFKDRR